jgi:hypothetical protein
MRGCARGFTGRMGIHSITAIKSSHHPKIGRRMALLDTGFSDPNMEALRQMVNEMILNGRRQFPKLGVTWQDDHNFWQT